MKSIVIIGIIFVGVITSLILFVMYAETWQSSTIERDTQPQVEPVVINEKSIVITPKVEPNVVSKLDAEPTPKIDCSGNAGCFIGTVTQVIDGDTINIDGQSIRFALASAPELNEFGGDTARELIEEICPVGSTATVDEDDGQTQGSYGRIVGVIYCNGVNLNEELVDSGLGYLTTGFCDRSEFSSHAWTIKYGCTNSNSKSIVSVPETIVTQTPQIQNDCDHSYPDFCIPHSPPDLDCKDIPQKRFIVLPPDPHRFDGDKDGIGCES